MPSATWGGCRWLSPRHPFHFPKSGPKKGGELGAFGAEPPEGETLTLQSNLSTYFMKSCAAIW